MNNPTVKFVAESRVVLLSATNLRNLPQAEVLQDRFERG